MIFFLKKYVYFKHVKSVLPEGLERRYLVYILLFSIKLQFIPVSFFCKLRHGIFCNFFVFFFFFCIFFFFFTKCTVLNGDVANNYVLGL